MTPKADSGNGGIFYLFNSGSSSITLESCIISDAGAGIDGGIGKIGGTSSTVTIKGLTLTNAYALAGNGGVFYIDVTGLATVTMERTASL